MIIMTFLSILPLCLITLLPTSNVCYGEHAKQTHSFHIKDSYERMESIYNLKMDEFLEAARYNYLAFHQNKKNAALGLPPEKVFVTELPAGSRPNSTPASNITAAKTSHKANSSTVPNTVTSKTTTEKTTTTFQSTSTSTPQQHLSNWSSEASTASIKSLKSTTTSSASPDNATSADVIKPEKLIQPTVPYITLNPHFKVPLKKIEDSDSVDDDDKPDTETTGEKSAESDENVEPMIAVQPTVRPLTEIDESDKKIPDRELPKHKGEGSSEGNEPMIAIQPTATPRPWRVGPKILKEKILKSIPVVFQNSTRITKKLEVNETLLEPQKVHKILKHIENSQSGSESEIVKQILMKLNSGDGDVQPEKGVARMVLKKMGSEATDDQIEAVAQFLETINGGKKDENSEGQAVKQGSLNGNESEIVKQILKKLSTDSEGGKVHNDVVRMVLKHMGSSVTDAQIKAVGEFLDKINQNNKVEISESEVVTKVDGQKQGSLNGNESQIVKQILKKLNNEDYGGKVDSDVVRMVLKQMGSNATDAQIDAVGSFLETINEKKKVETSGNQVTKKVLKLVEPMRGPDNGPLEESMDGGPTAGLEKTGQSKTGSGSNHTSYTFKTREQLEDKANVTKAPYKYKTRKQLKLQQKKINHTKAANLVKNPIDFEDDIVDNDDELEMLAKKQLPATKYRAEAKVAPTDETTTSLAANDEKKKNQQPGRKDTVTEESVTKKNLENTLDEAVTETKHEDKSVDSDVRMKDTTTKAPTTSQPRPISRVEQNRRKNELAKLKNRMGGEEFSQLAKCLYYQGTVKNRLQLIAKFNQLEDFEEHLKPSDFRKVVQQIGVDPKTFAMYRKCQAIKKNPSLVGDVFDSDEGDIDDYDLLFTTLDEFEDEPKDETSSAGSKSLDSDDGMNKDNKNGSSEDNTAKIGKVNDADDYVAKNAKNVTENVSRDEMATKQDSGNKANTDEDDVSGNSVESNGTSDENDTKTDDKSDKKEAEKDKKVDRKTKNDPGKMDTSTGTSAASETSKEGHDEIKQDNKDDRSEDNTPNVGGDKDKSDGTSDEKGTRSDKKSGKKEAHEDVKLKGKTKKDGENMDTSTETSAAFETPKPTTTEAIVIAGSVVVEQEKGEAENDIDSQVKKLTSITMDDLLALAEAYTRNAAEIQDWRREYGTPSGSRPSLDVALADYMTLRRRHFTTTSEEKEAFNAELLPSKKLVALGEIVAKDEIADTLIGKLVSKTNDKEFEQILDEMDAALALLDQPH